MSEVPEFMRQRGIDSIEDNVEPGYQVRSPSLAFVTLFRDALIERVTDKAPVNPAASGKD